MYIVHTYMIKSKSISKGWEERKLDKQKEKEKIIREGKKRRC